MSRLGYVRCVVVIGLANILVAAVARSATVTVIPVGNSAQLVIKFDGIITPRDADRLLQAEQQIKDSNKPLAGISLNSEGGAFAEAAKIARWLYEAKAAGGKNAVLILPNRVCASACFLILACAPQRYADITSRIGLHSARNADDREDAGSYAADTLMARIAKECGVPDYLIGKIVTTPPDIVYWLTKQDLLAMGVQVRDAGERSPAEGAATQPNSRPQARKGFDEATHVTTLTDLHLRVAPDPRAADAMGAPPNDHVPKGTRVSIFGQCKSLTNSGGRVPEAGSYWCPVAYGDYQGWANAYYLETKFAGRLACVMERTARGCEGTPGQVVMAQALASPQATSQKKCSTGARLQVAGCHLSGYGPLYCLEFRRQLEAANACQW